MAAPRPPATAPGYHTARDLVFTFCEVLGEKSVSAEENFFDEEWKQR